MKQYAIIAAGGAGVRMGGDVPKQFLLLHGRQVLWHTVKAFADALPGITIVVVAPEQHLATAKEICSAFDNIVFTAGGDSRFQSVKNGLAVVQEPAIVFVHDAVRCLVSKDLIVRCYEQALEKGSAIPSVAATDSVRLIDGTKSKVINRDLVRIIQTPQTFRSNIILPAFATDYKDAFTDEATVVELAGTEVHLVEGEHTNIKITRPADLVIAETILAERSTL